MPLKPKTVYKCTNCNASHMKWAGQCSECKEWNTLEQTTEMTASTSISKNKHSNWAGQSNKPEKLTDIKQHGPLVRLNTGNVPLNKLLGGGLVSDSVVLLGGDPGIGKSTLALQISLSLAQQYTVLYITGEENTQQVADRAVRLGTPSDNLLLMSETLLENIMNSVNEEAPAVLVIDSIQTLFSGNHEGAPGAVGQIKECAQQLNRMCKKQRIALVFICHVTKDGNIAGPKSLEHLVDVVLQFEGDDRENLRWLRSIKNRFGPSHELEAFTMEETGLKPVPDISTLFLSRNSSQDTGSAIFGLQEGHKTILLEIQALIDPSSSATTKIMPVDLSYYRLAMVIAIMQKYLGIDIAGYPVFASVSGGIKVQDSSADLALASAILSSWTQRPLPPATIVLGEMSLTGQIRPVRQLAQRLKDAKNAGMKEVWLPASQANLAGEGWIVRPIKTIVDLADLLGKQEKKTNSGNLQGNFGKNKSSQGKPRHHNSNEKPIQADS